MSELITGILGTACICSLGIIISKLCAMRDNVKDISPEYLLVRKEHYENLQRAAKKNIIIVEQPTPPDYSATAPLLDTPNTI